MGKKVRWFDAVQRILSASEPDREEKEDKQPAERLTSKSSFKKLWQLGKSSTSTSSSSAAPETAPAAHQQPDQQGAVEAKSAGTTSEQNDGGFQIAALAAPVAQQPPEATAIVTPRAPPRSKEELAAVRIQTACRGYLVRRGYQARAQARLMSLLEGVAVKRQTEEALYSMQAMTRIQTQIYARRVKKEKAHKSQVQPKQGPDKTKVGEDWDHTHQSKEQIEATLATKQEAASRRQRALSYAFSHQWRNRSPSSSSSSSGRGRVTPTHSHPPTFMDPGCPNWGWSWAERCMAASRPWESQTAPPDVKGRAAPAKSVGRAASPRVSISVQIPTTPTGRSARPAGRPSPSTPTQPRSPTVLGKTVASPRRAPNPRGSPFNRSGTTGSMLSERPRSSQEHLGACSGDGDGDGGKEASLRRTTSLRSGELPRRLNLGARDVDAGEAGGAPVTPSYMQATKSVKAKARSPAAADKAELPERALLVSSPSMKKRPSPEFAEKQGVSSPRTPKTPTTPSKAKAEIRTKRPPSPRF